MSPPPAPFTLEIPDHWTAEQALAVFELFNELTDTLWNRYDLAITELLAGELRQGGTSQLDLFDFDDSITF